MTRHTFATKSPGRAVMVCQCAECKGRTPEPRCRHTAELFSREAMIGPRVARTAPASLAQRGLFDEADWDRGLLTEDTEHRPDDLRGPFDASMMTMGEAMDRDPEPTK